MQMIEMEVTIKESPSEGILSGFPVGEGVFSIPINKLYFFDNTKDKITVGGSFTTSTKEQIITAGMWIDDIIYVHSLAHSQETKGRKNGSFSKV